MNWPLKIGLKNERSANLAQKKERRMDKIISVLTHITSHCYGRITNILNVHLMFKLIAVSPSMIIATAFESPPSILNNECHLQSLPKVLEHLQFF